MLTFSSTQNVVLPKIGLSGVETSFSIIIRKVYEIQDKKI